jgi:hypothetical protein
LRSTNVPVGPLESMLAIRTIASVPCSTDWVAVEVGRGVAGVDRVDAHLRIGLRVLGREHVHRGLRRRVRERDEPRLEPLGVAGDRERAHAAGDVDDDGVLGTGEQRRESAEYAHDAEHVRLVDLADIRRGGLLRGHARSQDAGVVHEHVEPRRCGDVLRRRGDARVAGHVELDEAGAEVVGRGLPALRVAGGDPDFMAGGEKTARGLAPRDDRSTRLGRAALSSVG